MTEVVFSVQALNIEVTADKATVHSIVDEPFTCDVIAELEMTIADAKAMFQFQSDAVDINNDNIEDLKFKLNYTTDINTDENGIPVEILGSSNFLTNTLCTGTDNSDPTYTAGTANASKKAVADDYLRYLAYKCFNTHLGVDLFNNETEVKTALESNAKDQLDQVLTALAGQGEGEFLDASACTSGTHNHPTYHIVHSMFNQVPERFYDLSDNFISGTQDNSGAQDSIFSVPFAADDIIQFKMTVKPADDQHDIVNKATNDEISLTDRTYRIRIKLVESLSI